MTWTSGLEPARRIIGAGVGGVLRKLRLRQPAELLARGVVSAHAPKLLDINVRGREQELQALRSAFATRKLIVIEGIAGIGKTTLGQAFAQKIMKTHPCIWVDCKPGMGLEGLTGALDVFFGESNKEFRAILTQELLRLRGPQQAVDAFVAALNRGHYVLFLDDFHLVTDSVVTETLTEALKLHAGEARTVILTREASPALQKLLARRERVGESEQARKMELEGLELEPALALWHDCGAEETPDGLKPLWRKVEGHPKALELCASLVRQGTGIPSLLKMPLYDKGAAQPLLRLLRETDRRLTWQERHLLQRCSVFDEPFAETALARLYGFEDWAPVAQRASDRFLLDRVDRAYRLHPLVRDYFYDCLREQRECHRLAGEHYLALASQAEEIVQRVELSLRAYQHFVQGRAWWYLSRLPYEIQPQLVTWGRWQEARQLCETGLEASRYLGERKEEAVYLHELGNMCCRVGDYEEARRLYQESLETFKKLGAQHEQAAVLHQLGMLAQDQGDYAQARRLYQESLEIARKLGAQDSAAITVWNLGVIAQVQGDHKTARENYEQALATFRALSDRKNEAGVLHQLGMLAHDQGDYVQARLLYGESLDIEKKLGDQAGIAKTLNALGNIDVAEGNFDAARQKLEESLAIAERLGDRLQVGYASGALALLEEKQGSLEAALAHIRQAEEIFQRLGVPEAEQARQVRERLEQGGGKGGGNE